MFTLVFLRETLSNIYDKILAMKTLSILPLSLLLISKVYSQKTWTGPASGGSWALAANWSGNAVPTANDIVIFPPGISGTISSVNAGSNITLGGLIVRSNSNIKLTNSSNKTITIANGSGINDLFIETGATLTLGTNVDITLGAGTATNNTIGNISGTMVVNTGRTFDTNNGNVVTTVNGTIQNEGTVTGNAAKLFFSNGSYYIHARAGGSIPTANWNSGSTCKITGLTGSDAGNDNQAFGNLIYECPNMTGTRNLGANGLSVAGNLEIINTGSAVLKLNLNNLSVGGNLAVSGGVFRIGDNTNRTITVAGSVSISGGTIQMSTGNNAADRGTLVISGNFSHNGGTITETSSGRGSINFAGNSIQSFYKNASAVISDNIDFTINPGATVDFGTSVLDGSTGNFNLSDNAKMITENTDGFCSSGNNGAIQVSGVRTFSSEADYEFRGEATGNFTTTVDPQVRNFIVNNTAGDINLSRSMTVNGSLILTAGALTTSISNLITIGATGFSTVATNTSFVNGPIAKVFAAPLTGFTFPVGKSGAGHRNIAVTAPSASSTFVAEFFRTVPPSGALGSGLTQISACEYWNLSRISGAAGTSTRVILSWENTSGCGLGQYVTDQTALRVAHLTGGTWVNEGYLASTGSNGSGTITSGNLLTAFSPFALASGFASENPLRVLIDNVTARQLNNGIQLEWTNLTEKDVANYVIERSRDGKDFTAINSQLALGNNDQRMQYKSFDASPLPGVNFYRIKVVETTGKSIYSKILNVNLDNRKTTMLLYPNPVTGGIATLSLGGLKPGQFDIQVINIAGKKIISKRLNVMGIATTQNLDFSALVPGVYRITVTGNAYRETKTFVLQ